MNYKAVISDFDDTLLRDDHTVSENTLKTIKDFENAGGFFAVCTGRMTKSALERARALGLEGYVCGYQGGTMADIKTGKLIIDERIPHELSVELLKEVSKLKRNKFQIYDGDRFITTPDNEYSKMYGKLTCVDPTFTDDTLVDYTIKNKLSLNKVLVYIHPIQTKRLIRKFSKKFPTLHFVSSKKNFFEITSEKATKGGMAKTICERMNIRREEMICVGDSLNDISMIKFAGLGACVDNARKEVKKIANHITLSNNDDGVAKIMRDVLDGKL